MKRLENSTTNLNASSGTASEIRSHVAPGPSTNKIIVKSIYTHPVSVNLIDRRTCLRFTLVSSPESLSILEICIISEAYISANIDSIAARFPFGTLFDSSKRLKGSRFRIALTSVVPRSAK